MTTINALASLTASEIRIVQLECQVLSAEITGYTERVHRVPTPAIELDDDWSPRVPLACGDASKLVERLAVHGIAARTYRVTDQHDRWWVLIGPQMDAGWEERAVERARREGILPTLPADA